MLQARHRFRDNARRGPRLSKIGHKAGGPSPEGLYVSQSVLQRRSVREQEMGAFAGKHSRGGGADSGRGPGNHGGLTLKTPWGGWLSGDVGHVTGLFLLLGSGATVF